jgi:hypothetical protein
MSKLRDERGRKRRRGRAVEGSIEMGRKASVMRVNPKHLTRRTMPCFQEMLVFLSCLHKFNYDDDKVVKEKNALNICMDVQVHVFVFFFVSSSTAVCFPCHSFLAGLGSLMLPARNLSLKFISVCLGSSALFMFPSFGFGVLSCVVYFWEVGFGNIRQSRASSTTPSTTTCKGYHAQ